MTASTGRRAAPRSPCCRLRPCSWCGTRSRSPRTSGRTTRSYVTGIELPADIPIEELLFFIVIPLCGLFTYNAVDTILTYVRRRSAPDRSSRRDGARLHAARRAGGDRGVRVGVRRAAHRPVPQARLLDLDGDRVRVPDTRRRLADEAVRTDRHLRRQPHQRHQVSVRHPRRGLPVRLRTGDRRAAAVGASAAARSQDRECDNDRRSKCRRCPPRSMRARRPTTAWWAPTPATTATCGCRRSACGLPTAARDYGCSTPAAAPARPPRRCCPSPRRPRSSPSTRRRACWPRPPPSAGPRRCGSCTAASRTSPRRVSTDRSTASSPRTCCATSRTPTPNCASSERCCGPGRRWRCTSTRSATPGSRRPCGTRCARRSSSRWAGCAAVTPASTATCGAA